MPRRLLIPARWLQRHVRQHPGRLITTSIVLLLLSTALLLYAIRDRWDEARQGRIDNCIALNELSRKVYVTLSDLGIPHHQIVKFRPSQNCESIP